VLERRYDAQFRVVFDAIRELMTPPARAKRAIGFRKQKELGVHPITGGQTLPCRSRYRSGLPRFGRLA
jgi:hypothetical protein